MKTFMLALLAISTLCHADEKLPEITIGKKTYKECTLSMTGASRVKIVHSSGVATVDTMQLPKDIREKIKGYNSDKDLAQRIQEQAQKKLKQDWINKVKKAKTTSIHVYYNREDGLLASYQGDIIYIPHTDFSKGIDTDKSYDTTIYRTGTQAFENGKIIPKYELLDYIPKEELKKLQQRYK